MTIVIGTPVVGTGGGRVTYEVELAGLDGVERLRFSMPESAAGLVNARADAAVVALLMPAMRLRRDLVVEGPVTGELVWNLRQDVPVILRGVRPELSGIAIDARDEAPPLAPGHAVATAYSAGVDSYATLARHHFAADAPEALRVTHLLFNNVGSHGRAERGRELYRRRLERLREGATTMGLPLIDVDSNVDDLYTAPGLGFQQTHTMRNAAVAHLLAGGLRRFLYASSVPYRDVTATPIYDLSYADPMLLPALSSGSLILRSSGADLDRAQKTALVARVPHSYDRLDVCTESVDGTNCSRCWKCRRTMLTLDLLGALDHYRGVFDVPGDPRWREAYTREALDRSLQPRSQPSTRGVVELYDERVGIPRAWRAAARGRATVAAARSAARSAARGAVRIVRPHGGTA
ncbi:hypothetical protein GCM10017608_04710 [Agromyces luteolus]|uniref:Uncharacterized protein n=1 Tax=Agromyces luteolus TaxID=88373 RepID=A0A7C9HGP4_9MICO|nr:hypothetical protein [Agromyces luteolus]MUN06426.1 hypothetical protein [Agromyces luteolus]GLK26539.1 hypothetical protein GCM10017608_04710 [Agromyces luteolus]